MPVTYIIIQVDYRGQDFLEIGFVVSQSLEYQMLVEQPKNEA